MNNGYLLDDGTPNLPVLQSLFNRCSPSVPGGLSWMDNVRFNRWPGQFSDGKKHDVAGDVNGAALPWSGASDMKPMLVDDIIAERKSTLTAAFWSSLVQQGAAESEEASYAVALVEWLVFTKMLHHLNDNVDLSADYQEHVGWCLLAPRWKREIGLRRYMLKLSEIVSGAQNAQQQIEQAANVPIGTNAPPQIDPIMLGLAQLPTLIADPTMEDQAVEFLRQWYDWYVAQQVPEDLLSLVPKTTAAKARKAVRALRSDERATVALPYLCKNEAEIVALKPYEECFLPPEMTSENEIVFQVEKVSEAELRGRAVTEEFREEWVTQALTHKGEWSANSLPTGTVQGLTGLLGGAGTAQTSTGTLPGENSAVEIIHAVYRAADEDGIPAVYCTTFHRSVNTAHGSRKSLYGAHDIVEDAGGELPYVACMRERWSRGITTSRGVPEMAHTQQNVIKGLMDGIIDRQSITLLPPVNVYESPTGTKYQFGPAKQNYVRRDREPAFMQMPGGQGMADAVEVHAVVKSTIDNRFGLMSEDVPAPRQQINQGQAVRRFLLSWTKAFKQVLVLYQAHGDDREFAEVTGAPDGWLESRRNKPGLLTCALEFDAREFDSELMMKRIEAMNKIVLPNDILGVINRGKWAAWMTRGILGSRAAKGIVVPQNDASQALRDKASLEVLKMFAGNTPNFLDDKDPTAASLLELTKEIVTANPVYMRALDDEALVTLLGQQAPMAAQQLQQQGGRRPDEAFSKLLVKWLTNLKFIGVTQVENKQIGRIGVDPNDDKY